MRSEDIKMMDEIITGLIDRNIMAGATIEKAIDQAYNRLSYEQPEVFEAWVNAKMQ